MKVFLKIIFAIPVFYLAIAWAVFQFNNPLANRMTFFREFVSVVTFKTLPEYQPYKPAP